MHAEPPASIEPSLAEIARRAARAVATTKIDTGLQVTIDGRSYLARPGDIIGRGGTVAADRLIAHETISRRHVEISRQGGRWYLTVPLSVANSTLLDGVEMPRGQACPLMGKHLLRLAKSCVVTIEV